MAFYLPFFTVSKLWITYVSYVCVVHAEYSTSSTLYGLLAADGVSFFVAVGGDARQPAIEYIHTEQPLLLCCVPTAN